VTPPLAVDIDGTLTDDQRRVDPRVLPVLREWDAPVVVATGKAFPYPVAMCEFLGLPITVVAENGGVVAIEGDDVVFTGDPDAAWAVAEEYREEGHALGWGEPDFVNRWRETEVAVNRDQPLAPLERIAAAHGLQVVDTGFAYHVKSPEVDKGGGLVAVADELGLSADAFAAVGDSENDADMFRVAGESYAVANADGAAKAAAETLLEESHADGFLAAVDAIRDA
jgi:phosphoglycolate phosphatase (TIGR01487 family)